MNIQYKRTQFKQCITLPLKHYNQLSLDIYCYKYPKKALSPKKKIQKLKLEFPYKLLSC